MTLSPIFEQPTRQQIERGILEFINTQTNFLSSRTIASPRAVGDAIQSLLEDNFGSLFPQHIKDYSSRFARRAMADLAFSDAADLYHVVDIKTHRLNTAFNMPNLTSVERLARFYEDDHNYFDLLLIAYSVDEANIRVERIHFLPIEYLLWDCLTIGALGWGQIQLANAHRILIDPAQTRKDWMVMLCDVLMEFYPAEIAKIEERIDYFKKVKERWLAK